MSRSLALALTLAFVVTAAAADDIVVPYRGSRLAAPAAEALPQTIVINAACSEVEPNETPATASPMTLPASCSGFASSTDASSIKIDFGGGVSEGIQDLFSFTLSSSARVNASLSWTNTNADLDLFLFQQNGTSLNVVSASTTNGSAPESLTSPLLSPGTYYVGVSAFSGGSAYGLNVSQASSSSSCSQDTNTMCLSNGRFRVRATYDSGTQNGNGGAVRLTSDTGYFWFFGNSNVEMVVKILDACSFNNRFWVFAGGLTDVGVSLEVVDTVAGVTKKYSNARGVAFDPIQDTDAFSTCAAAPCSYALAPPSQSFGSSGGGGSVTMTAGTGCPWTATSDSSWITIRSIGSAGTGNGMINFDVAANGGGARSGTISAGGQSATISQSGSTPSCSYSLSPASSTSYPASGGSGTISVSAPSGCAWNATASAFWITVTGGGSGSGNGTVSYSVAANSGSARTSSVSIAGQNVPIAQAGAPPPSYDGTWSGTTSQGKTISFTISGNAFTSFTLNWHATGSCTVDGSTTTTFGSPQPISGTSFNLSSSGPTSISINGTFSSTSAASGNFSVNFSQPFPACTASGSGTFNVTKQ